MTPVHCDRPMRRTWHRRDIDPEAFMSGNRAGPDETELTLDELRVAARERLAFRGVEVPGE